MELFKDSAAQLQPRCGELETLRVGPRHLNFLEKG